MFTYPLPTNTLHTLKTPLGEWIVRPHKYIRAWPFLYSPTHDAIYQNNALDYSVHKRLRHDFDKEPAEYTAHLPQDAVPIDPKETPYTWIFPRQITAQDLNPTHEDPTTMELLVDMRPPWERNLLLELRFIQNEAAVWEALSSQCFVATDGSAPHGKGSFAWTLSTSNGDRLARCSGPVFGHAISSY